YSMEISVSQGYPKTIATDLEDGDAAILLSDFIQNSFGTLTWKVFRRNCKIFTGLMSCQAPVQIETGTESLWMAPLGNYSHATYDSPTVGVADNGVTGDWEAVKVTGVTTGPELVGVPFTFAAQGYGVNGSTSTFPQVVNLAVGTPFAVYETDFYDPFYYDPVEQMEITGQETPSGLAWGHVSGTRNGSPFRYTTALPKMVHDRIERCPVADGFTEPMGPARTPTPTDSDLNWPPRDGPFAVMAVGDSFYEIPFEAGV